MTTRERWWAEKQTEAASLSDLRLTEIVPSRRDFTQFVATQKRGLAVVPRVQRANPDTGRTWPGLAVDAFARACDDAEAGALAVRTAALFGSGLADLDAVVGAVTAPVLRDDLCLHRQQVYQARLHGADAVLLPAAGLAAAEVRELAAVASSMHMASVVEIRSAADLAVARDLATACVGIGAAGSDGYADAARVHALAAELPRQRTVLLLAEVRQLDELLPLVGLIDAAVVGDALLDAADPGAALAALLARVG